jgi:methyl coenzyme M reductase gamma subunit
MALYGPCAAAHASPCSPFQARPLAEDLLEYAQLCDAVYDLEVRPYITSRYTYTLTYRNI